MQGRFMANLLSIEGKCRSQPVNLRASLERSSNKKRCKSHGGLFFPLPCPPQRLLPAATPMSNLIRGQFRLEYPLDLAMSLQLIEALPDANRQPSEIRGAEGRRLEH